MTPIFIIITNAGAVYIRRHADTALALGGTIFRFTNGTKSQQIASVTGASAVVATTLSGAYSELT